MSTSTTSVSSTTLSNGRSEKVKKSYKIIFRLSPHLLDQYPSTVPRKESKSASSSAPSPPKAAEAVEDDKATSSNDYVSEQNATPIPNGDPPPPGDPPKKRKGPLPGSKRGLGQGIDNAAKPRGKPGPKKKPRLEDGTIDHTVKTAFAPGITPITTHKLGPKANQGAINAGLRALDRSGKPCRKWARKPFQLKSFTGVVWEVPSWRGGTKLQRQIGDDSTDSKDVSQQSSSDIKPNDSSTAMESNPGDQPEPMAMSTPAASSPVPV